MYCFTLVHCKIHLYDNCQKCKKTKENASSLHNCCHELDCVLEYHPIQQLFWVILVYTSIPIVYSTSHSRWMTKILHGSIFFHTFIPFHHKQNDVNLNAIQLIIYFSRFERCCWLHIIFTSSSKSKTCWYCLLSGCAPLLVDPCLICQYNCCNSSLTAFVIWCFIFMSMFELLECQLHSISSRWATIDALGVPTSTNSNNDWSISWQLSH